MYIISYLAASYTSYWASLVLRITGKEIVGLKTSAFTTALLSCSARHSESSSLCIQNFLLTSLIILALNFFEEEMGCFRGVLERK